MFKVEKTGLGLLFKEYGRPGKMGVGHMKQDLKNSEDGELSTSSESKGKPDKPDKPDKGGKPEGKGGKGKGKGNK